MCSVSSLESMIYNFICLVYYLEDEETPRLYGTGPPCPDMYSYSDIVSASITCNFMPDWLTDNVEI